MQLKIATFNTGLLRIFGRDVVPHTKERFPHLLILLAELNADIICLQEVFNKKYYEILAEVLKDKYPHHDNARSRKPYFPPGLCTFSKFPITENYFERFTKHKDIERLSSHGFLMTKIKTPSGSISVLNTHLSSGGVRHYKPANTRTLSVQESQTAELFAAAKKKKSFLVGDFNCGPKRNSDVYAKILQSNWTDGALVEGQKTLGDTLAHENTLRHHRRSPRISDRVDHLFYRNDAGIKTTLVLRFGDSLIEGKTIHLSDHYGLLFTLEIS